MSTIRLDRHPPVWFRLRSALRRSAPVRRLYRRRWARRADVAVVSFPKAGRTWLRALLSAALHDHYKIPRSAGDVLRLDVVGAETRIPRIRFKHDDAPQLKTPAELVRSKSEYRDVRVVFMARDLRDLAVSAYFQMTRRESRFDGDLEAFLRNPRGGADTMIEFFNIWAEERGQAKDFLLLRYEDLHRDPVSELRRVLDFCGVGAISPEVLGGAVEAASFDQMRHLEATAEATSARLRPGEPDDPESYKTRQGRVGGYEAYLSTEQAAWLEDRMRSELDPIYGYPFVLPAAP